MHLLCLLNPVLKKWYFFLQQLGSNIVYVYVYFCSSLLFSTASLLFSLKVYFSLKTYEWYKSFVALYTKNCIYITLATVKNTILEIFHCDHSQFVFTYRNKLNLTKIIYAAHTHARARTHDSLTTPTHKSNRIDFVP